MKNILGVFIIFFLVLNLYGCSEPTMVEDQDIQVSEEGSTDLDGDEVLEEEADVYDEASEQETGMTFDIDDLPEGYPEDIIPIVESGDVEAGMANGKELLAKVYCTQTPKEVADFYLGVMEKSEGFKKDEMGGVYFLDGVIDGYDISIRITESTYYDGYLTSLTIIIE